MSWALYLRLSFNMYYIPNKQSGRSTYSCTSPLHISTLPSPPSILPWIICRERMLKSNNEGTQCILQVKQDDKFFSRLLAKENSTANTSCRVYYGLAPGAVPFVWESQPGTPKNPISSTTIPPLTPPPSYLFNSNQNGTKKDQKPNLLMTIFPKLNMKKTHKPSPSISSLSSPSFPSAWSFPSSSRSSFSVNTGEEEPSSPTSISCFQIRRSGYGSCRRSGNISAQRSLNFCQQWGKEGDDLK